MGATSKARLAFLGLALAQHALLIVAIYGARDEFPEFFFYTAGQLPTLALLLFGRAPTADEDRSLLHLGRVTLFSALMGGLAVFRYPIGQAGGVSGSIVGNLVFGAIAGGGMGALFHLLFTVADRWRCGGPLAHALDAWAALAIYPTCAGVFLQVAAPQNPPLYNACARALLLVGALVGVGVTGVELWWRREIGRALAGRLPGRRVIDAVGHADAATPDWSLTASSDRRVLVAEAQTGVYRGFGGGEVVAWVPAETPPSWRLALGPSLILVAALGW